MSNVDHRELAKFNAMAATWWDPDGDFRPLHDLNPVRLAFIAQHAPLAGAQVLDVGCGGGLLSEAMAVAGARVTGLDLAEDALTVARAHAAEAGVAVDYQLAEVGTCVADRAGTFDVVTCLEMLEHVPDPEAVIAACAQALRPGGHLFLSTLNRTVRSFALGIVAAEYVLGLVPRGTHEYGRFIRPSELARAARSSGLDLVSLRGLTYNPYLRRAALTDDVAVNYIACFQRR